MTRCPYCLTIFTQSPDDDDECPVCREIAEAMAEREAQT